MVIKSKEKQFVYVELKKYSEKSKARMGEFVQVETTKPFLGPKTSDKTILLQSKQNDGVYDAKAHANAIENSNLLPPDVTPKEYANVHVKRLEVLAKKGLVKKLSENRFAISKDFLEKLGVESQKSQEKFTAHIKVIRLSPSRLRTPNLSRGLKQ